MQWVFDELQASSTHIPAERMYVVDPSLSVTLSGWSGFRPRTGRVPASDDVITRGVGLTTSVDRRPRCDLRITFDRRRQHRTRRSRKRTSRPEVNAMTITTVALVDRRSRLVQRSSSTDDVRLTTAMSTYKTMNQTYWDQSIRAHIAAKLYTIVSVCVTWHDKRQNDLFCGKLNKDCLTKLSSVLQRTRTSLIYLENK